MYLRGMQSLGDIIDGTDYGDSNTYLPPDMTGPSIDPMLVQQVPSAPTIDSSTSAGSMVPFYADPANSAAIDQLNAQAQAGVLPNGSFPPVNSGSTTASGNPISSLFNAVGSIFGAGGAGGRALPGTQLQRGVLTTYPAGSSPFPAGVSGFPTLTSTPVLIGLAALAAILLMRD